MAIVTFISDFGYSDHYVAAVKGKMLSLNSELTIVDISHGIKPYDILHAAEVLQSTFRDFPEGTVHIIAVDSIKERSRAIAVLLEGHYFLGFDCGILGMISNRQPAEMILLRDFETTFPAKEALAPAAVRIASGEEFQKVGEPIAEIQRLFGRQLKATKRQIVGNVMNVDRYGNLLTNIPKVDFDKIMELNGVGTRFVVRFGREVFGEIHRFFSDVESGDCFLLFNSSGMLQIGINKGNASQLLGLSVDAPVTIEFMS